jgi:hypothetical protein
MSHTPLTPRHRTPRPASARTRQPASAARRRRTELGLVADYLVQLRVSAAWPEPVPMRART